MPWPDQGQCRRGRVRRRRAHLHGAQQPEPPQRFVPRLPEAVGGLYRRQDQLDRPRSGGLQSAPAAVDRHGHGRLRHRRDGRALRGRHGRPRPPRRDARLGEGADRGRRPRRLPAAAGRHLGRQDLSDQHRRRLPHLRVSHRLFHRSGDHGGHRHDRAADDLGAGERLHQEGEGAEGPADGHSTPTASSIR